LLAGCLQRLVLGIWDPNNKVLTSCDKHAVDMGKFHSRDSSGMKINQLYFLLCCNVPANNFALSLGAWNQVFAIRAKPSFKEHSRRSDLVVDWGFQFVFRPSIVGVDQENHIFCCPEHNQKSVGWKFYLSDFRTELGIFQLKNGEGFLLIILSVKEMNLLNHFFASALDEETG
jgi:hypothetical protein